MPQPLLHSGRHKCHFEQGAGQSCAPARPTLASETWPCSEEPQRGDNRDDAGQQPARKNVSAMTIKPRRARVDKSMQTLYIASPERDQSNKSTLYRELAPVSRPMSESTNSHCARSMVEDKTERETAKTRKRSNELRDPHSIRQDSPSRGRMPKSSAFRDFSPLSCQAGTDTAGTRTKSKTSQSPQKGDVEDGDIDEAQRP